MTRRSLDKRRSWEVASEKQSQTTNTDTRQNARWKALEAISRALRSCECAVLVDLFYWILAIDLTTPDLNTTYAFSWLFAIWPLSIKYLYNIAALNDEPFKSIWVRSITHVSSSGLGF